MNHSLTSAELDAIEAHLQFLAAAAEQDARHSHSGGITAALTFLATARRDSFKARAKKRQAALQPAAGFPR